jgi:hypothetical protein
MDHEQMAAELSEALGEDRGNAAYTEFRIDRLAPEALA